MGPDAPRRDARVAGVDLGTLTCRLLVADVAAGRIVAQVHGARRLLRLGEGVQAERRLRPAAIERVVRTLVEWRGLLDRLEPDAEVAVATSAVRDAANREEFLRAVAREAGFSVEVLSGEEEARRTMVGIRSGLPSGVGRVLGLDIGGGSTELIRDDGGGVPVVRSLDVGVVRLSEGVLGGDRPTEAEIMQAVDRIETLLRPAVTALGPMDGTVLVGTAGTVTTLAAVAQGLRQYDAARVHNYRLSLAEVRRLEALLRRMNRDERRAVPGLEPGREDVILAGTLILRVLMELGGFTGCLVSDLGLREGIVLDRAARLVRASGFDRSGDARA